MAVSCHCDTPVKTGHLCQAGQQRLNNKLSGRVWLAHRGDACRRLSGQVGPSRPRARDDAGGHTGGVSYFAAEALAEGPRALTQDPARAAVFCDIDGTLASFVDRADDAGARGPLAVPGCARPPLRLRRPCVRQSAPDRRVRAMARPRAPVRRRRRHEGEAGAANADRDKGPIAAFRWRGVPGKDAAPARLQGRRGGGGAPVRWGRKVLEVRRRVPIEKGQSVRDLAGAGRPHVALFGGSDVTGLDASGVLDALVADGRPSRAVRVGVRSAEGPREIVMRAGLLADGVEGFACVLEGLLRAAR